MFFELPWLGVAKDAMAVAISIKYSVCQNAHFTFYSPPYGRGGIIIIKVATYPQNMCIKSILTWEDSGGI